MSSKNVFILGDSYSTYEGFIPEDYDSYYGDKQTNQPVIGGVEKTWWKRLEDKKIINIVSNDSFSGSTICNTVRETLTTDTSFINRIDRYISDGYFSKNKIDTLFVFGGTNDSWIDAPIGELKYSNWFDDDLKCVLPAFCYLLQRLKETDKNLRVIVLINDCLKAEIAENLVVACKSYDAEHIELKDINKENGHPTRLGMEQISNQVEDYLAKQG